jgi:hypothetical protein
MALTVETGAGVAGADSYISLAYADAYHAALGHTDWAAATESAKEIACRLATIYMDSVYLWRGTKSVQSNNREWPRYGAEDCDGYEIGWDAMPAKLKDACAELSLRALIIGALISDVTPTTTGVKREKVDVLEVEYFQGRSTQAVYTAVDLMLACLITGKRGSGSGVAEMVRG